MYALDASWRSTRDQLHFEERPSLESKNLSKSTTCSDRSLVARVRRVRTQRYKGQRRHFDRLLWVVAVYPFINLAPKLEALQGNACMTSF